MDCLLVHVPKLLERSPYLGWASRIDFVSAGTFSIAEELRRRGASCRIVHVGVEKRRDPAFSLVERVRASGARVVAFALHWHPQTYDVIEAARQLKAALPEVLVVLGGLTATAFAEDLLRTWPFVDAVIRGEAERPMVQLVEAVTRGRGLAEVENLAWRDGHEVHVRPVTSVATAEEVSGWGFDAWDLVDHPEDLLRLSWRNTWEPEFAASARERAVPTLFGAALGRGCMGTCTWCAGSFGPTKAATGRRRTAWRAADRVAHTVRAAFAAGARRIYTCFDPHPNRMPEVLEVFTALGALPERVPLDFETFGLPSEEVVEAFARHLPEGSRLIVSPETADEGLRRRHRSFPFTNDELLARLGLMERLGVESELYFVVGLPGETRDTVLRTAELARSLKARFSRVRSTFAWPLEMEPGSPWFLHPERYGITLRRRTVADFHAAHGRPEFSLGYDLPTLSEGEILALHDELFLPLGPTERSTLLAHWRAHPRDHSRVRQLT